MDGELTVWNLVVATCQCQSGMTTLISDHVKDKQLIYGRCTTVIYHRAYLLMRSSIRVTQRLSGQNPVSYPLFLSGRDRELG